MREQLGKLPRALQRQVLAYLAGGAGFVFLLVVILACFRDVSLGMPCLAAAAFLFVNGSWLLYHGICGNYICVEGVYEKIRTGGLRKKIQGISIIIGQDRLTIPVRRRMKTLSVGDTVTVYVSDKVPVYEYGDGYVIYSYYALEIKKGG